MTDTPKIHDTLAAIDKETEHPEPYRLGLSGGRTITFPDPGEMGMAEFEEFMADITDKPNSVILKRWLSEEDYKKLLDENLNIRQTVALSKRVVKHYEYIFGPQGEGTASTA